MTIRHDLTPGIRDWGWIDNTRHGKVIVVTPEGAPRWMVWARRNRALSLLTALGVAGVFTLIWLAAFAVPHPPAGYILIAALVLAAIMNLAATGVLSATPDNYARITEDDHSEHAWLIRRLVTSLDGVYEPSHHRALAAAVAGHQDRQ